LETLLHHYARTGNATELQRQLEWGLDANGRNKAGRTPIWIAARHGHILCVQNLIEAGADCRIADRNGRNALFAAAGQGNARVIDLLSEFIDPNSRDPYGKRPLHIAARFGVVKAVRMLLRCGAEKEIVDRYGKTPYDEASIAMRTVAEMNDGLVDTKYLDCLQLLKVEGRWERSNFKVTGHVEFRSGPSSIDDLAIE
jgi:ankyrin repeat protein